MNEENEMITVEISVSAPIERVWECWTEPSHITQWNFANDEWCCPSATNDLQPRGEFVWRMEAKDGSMGFDFTGTYQEILKEKAISYTMSDGRNVVIGFEKIGNEVRVSESFEAEGTNSDEQQRDGWQAILQNFKAHVESM